MGSCHLQKSLMDFSTRTLDHISYEKFKGLAIENISWISTWWYIIRNFYLYLIRKDDFKIINIVLQIYLTRISFLYNNK